MIAWDEFFNQTLTEIKDDTIPKKFKKAGQGHICVVPKGKGRS